MEELSLTMDLDMKQIEELKKLMKVDPAAAAAKIKEYLERLDNIPLNIAITGESGSGKSSFVNAFRGMTNKDKGAAPTGCVETTTEPTEYSHPTSPNVILWDLPGVGTTKFPADKYLRHVGFEKFDFFIIISATRFTENDVKLVLEIQKMGKKFYFVRSKVDSDLNNEKMSKTDFKKENTLEQIRDNCIQGLQEQGFESPQVFLMSNFDLHLYDFALLHETLKRELPEHQKHALLMAMPNINLEIIKKKEEAFQSKIKHHAAASAAGAAFPVPGLSAAVDLALMTSVVKKYLDGFCLDISSLPRLADSTGVPSNDLRATVNSVLATRVRITETILKMLTQLTTATALMTAEEGARFIPLFGIPVAMSLSFITTYKVLSFFLNGLAKEAQKEFTRALGLNTVNVI